jgi:D-aminopeptidase
MVIPLGAAVLGGVVVVVSSGSSELTHEVKKEMPKVPITVAKPAFSRNFRLDAVRVPELGN